MRSDQKLRVVKLMTPTALNSANKGHLDRAANIVNNETLSIGRCGNSGGGNGEEAAGWGSARARCAKFKAIEELVPGS
jgi:hypothetical protein